MGKTTGCLIIHGFGGSVNEVAPLEEYLSEKGYITLCPSLKGHTGRKSDLAESGYKDWLGSAEEGLLKLQSQCQDVIIIGFSMGGHLAIHLALKYGINAVVTLNTPIYYWDIRRILLNIADDLKAGSSSNISRYIKSCFDKPLASLINFRILLGKTKKIIPEVRCPIFIAQAVEDDTVQHRSADFIYRGVRSAVKELRYYSGSGHLICHSSVSKKVFEDIEAFVKNLSNRL